MVELSSKFDLSHLLEEKIKKQLYIKSNNRYGYSENKSI
jgi:hypothetical protein